MLQCLQMRFIVHAIGNCGWRILIYHLSLGRLSYMDLYTETVNIQHMLFGSLHTERNVRMTISSCLNYSITQFQSERIG